MSKEKADQTYIIVYYILSFFRIHFFNSNVRY